MRRTSIAEVVQLVQGPNSFSDGCNSNQRSEQDFDFESASYNLEHILPEHPDESWSYIEEAKQDRLIYRIGNKTPLETKRNRELGHGD